MFSIYWRFRDHSVLVTILILLGLSSCSPQRNAYFQPEPRTYPRIRSSLNELTPPANALPAPQTAVASTVPAAFDTTIVQSASVQSSFSAPAPRVNRHVNPEGYQHKRFSRFFASLPVAHVATQRHMIDRHSRSRKTYPLAWAALCIALLSVGSLFMAGGGALLWLAGITLPLAATLMGVASLSTINRNLDRYRGKGWAMAAILLATGVLGLALVALAALSVSNVVWKK